MIWEDDQSIPQAQDVATIERREEARSKQTAWKIRMMCKEILDKVVDGVEGASCGMDILSSIVERAWWQYKVGVVWSWVEMDGNLLAEINQKARIMKNQISILKERNEKEERLLRQASLEHE